MDDLKAYYRGSLKNRIETLEAVKQALGSIEGRVVAIVGDIAHSRVARSDIHAFSKLGAEVRLAGPCPYFLDRNGQMSRFVQVCPFTRSIPNHPNSQ